MKTAILRLVGTAAAVAVTGVAVYALDKILKKKEPLQVEQVEFPEAAETDPEAAAEAAEAYAEGTAKAEEPAAEAPAEAEAAPAPAAEEAPAETEAPAPETKQE